MLIAVKKSLTCGEFEKYLDEKVDIGIRTAQQFMQVARGFPSMSTQMNLRKYKLFAFLDVLQEERQTFLGENPVNEMIKEN